MEIRERIRRKMAGEVCENGERTRRLEKKEERKEKEKRSGGWPLRQLSTVGLTG